MGIHKDIYFVRERRIVREKLYSLYEKEERKNERKKERIVNQN